MRFEEINELSLCSLLEEVVPFIDGLAVVVLPLQGQRVQDDLRDSDLFNSKLYEIALGLLCEEFLEDGFRLLIWILK